MATNSLFVYGTTEISHNARLAVFDLDGTLIKTASGKKFPVDSDDWTWLYGSTKSTLRKLLKKGYHLIIISNQAVKGENKQKAIKNKVKKIVKVLKEKGNNNITVFLATVHDKWRKPHTTIWDTYLNHCDKENSFYVGDAAGRKGDHGCSDRKFAHNIGIKFYTPEMYFLNEEDREYSWARPKGAFFKPAITTDTLFDLPTLTSPYVVILIGPPASGKTTFAKQYLPDTSVVGMDIYKTKAKTFKKYKELLGNDENIVVDNTNPSKEGRDEYVALAKEYNYRVYYFAMDVSKELAYHLNYYRTAMEDRYIPEIAYRIYYSKLEMPKKYVLVPPLLGLELTKAQRRIFMQYSE